MNLSHPYKQDFGTSSGVLLKIAHSQGFTPSIKFSGTHLNTRGRRDTTRVKCLAFKEHNMMTLTVVQTLVA